LRQEIIWHKTNTMPESVTDRCTKSHEHLFLLSKSERYAFDHHAIAETAVTGDNGSRFDTGKTADHQGRRMQRGVRPGRSGNKSRKPATGRGCPADGVAGNVPWEGTTRNKRDVWPIPTARYPGAHFATFPEALVEPCLLAGAPAGSLVIDPFCGSGTVGVVAKRLGCRFVGIELNPEYAAMAERRIGAESPSLFAGMTAKETP